MRRLLPALLVLSILPATFCFAEGGGSTLQVENQLLPFTSDGCTGFLNGDLSNHQKWLHCCIQHDIKYWQGGTKKQRQEADRGLRECVEKTGEPVIGPIMQLGTRLGGYVGLPTSWRWGYGWAFSRGGYRPLTKEEQAQVAEQLKKMPPTLSDVPMVSPPIIPDRLSVSGDYCLDIAARYLNSKLGQTVTIEDVQEELLPNSDAGIERVLKIKVQGCDERFEIPFVLTRLDACKVKTNEFAARMRIQLRIPKVFPTGSCHKLSLKSQNADGCQ